MFERAAELTRQRRHIQALREEVDRLTVERLTLQSRLNAGFLVSSIASQAETERRASEVARMRAELQDRRTRIAALRREIQTLEAQVRREERECLHGQQHHALRRTRRIA